MKCLRPNLEKARSNPGRMRGVHGPPGISSHCPCRLQGISAPCPHGLQYGGAFVFCFVCFLGPCPWHREVPRLGVELELQLLAGTTATATPDLSHDCSLHHSSQQRWILNPLGGARDRTCNLMVPSRIRFCCATMGTSEGAFGVLHCRASPPLTIIGLGP